MKLPRITLVLEEAEKITSRKKRIEFLRSHRPNKVLLQLLKYIYDPAIEFSLPAGEPPYTDCEWDDQETRLYQEARRLYIFVKGNASGLHPTKKELLFIEILETIDPKDAKFLCSVKDKKMPYKGITKKVVQEAYPGLIDN